MKNLLIIFNIFVFINLYSFNTQFNEINPLSIEWQKAGYKNKEADLPTPDTTITVPNNVNIADFINNFTINNPDISLSWDNIVQLILPAGTFQITNPINIPSHMIIKGYSGFLRDSDTWNRTILEFNFNSNHNQNCINFINKENSGVEDIWIKRVDQGSTSTGDNCNNFYIEESNDCWIYGVESDNPIKHHIVITNSSNIQVTGCYLHDTQFHGEGGFGYGVICENLSRYCLIENNIIRKCRHGLLVQNGAYQNVFGYNYIRESYQSNDNWTGTIFPNDFSGDIVCHGEPSYESNPSSNLRGPKENLFEGNICDWIWVDSFHGQNKKFNTFFRNKATNYGMCIFPKLPAIFGYYSEKQLKQITVYNFFKNSIWAPEILFSLHDILSPRSFSGQQPFEKHNLVKRLDFWGSYYTRPWTDGQYNTSCSISQQDDSYYLSQRPEWIPISIIPSLWPVDPSESNISQFRWNNANRMTISRDNSNYATEDSWRGNLTIDETYANDNDTSGWETFFLYPWQVLTIEENSNITFSQNCKIRIYGKLQIGSGTHIHIDPDADFEVYGIIKAHNVTFTGKHIIFDNTDSHSWVPIPNVTFSWTLDDERYSDFTNCTFQNTYYDDLNDNVYGGSIYVRDYFNIRFINCSFNNNRAKAGGAIAVVNSSILVNKCFFSNNESQHGGAIYSEYSSLNISQNQFVQNISTNKGGAIYTVYISDRNDNDLLISTNYFDRNHSSRGGAVSFNESQGKLLFINNSLINNTSNYGNGYSISHYYPSINDMYINNIIWKSNYQQAKDIAHRSRHLYFYPENSNLTFINNYIQGDDFGICGNVDLNIGDYDGYDNINIINDSYKINNLSNCYNTGLPYNNLVILLNEYNRQNIFNTNHNLLYEDIESKIRNLNKIEIGAYEVIDTGLNLNDTSVSFSSSTPGVTKKISIVIANTDSNNNININDVRILDSNFKIISHPNVVNINSYSTIDISFTPQKMFNNYNTKLQIYSNDPLNPLIEIPVSGNSFLHSGWNWISLPTNSINIDNFTNELNPYGVNILGCDGSLNFINDNWVTNGFTSLNNKKLYKINMSSTCSNFDINFTPTGITNTNPNITLYPNVDNWVGYWKSNPQNIDIAFGSNFDMVLSIKAENWYYTKPQQIIRNGLEAEPLPSHKIRPLHFGKGYIVRVSSIIRNFNWNSTNIISSNSEQIKPSYFTYNDSNEYRVVDIININDDIQEIGAFIEDTCIGASTVENGNAQILLYDTLNKDDFDNIHFQTYTNNKQNHTQSFYYFNNITNLFEKKISINNNLDYYLISFSKVVGEDVPSLSILMNVYPNPFTKSLNIDYQSKTNDKIKVSIYNIKGQKVKYLYDGNIKKGSNKFNWNAEDSKNNLVSSGIYFVKITNSKQSLIKKIIYLR